MTQLIYNMKSTAIVEKSSNADDINRFNDIPPHEPPLQAISSPIPNYEYGILQQVLDVSLNSIFVAIFLK